MASFVSIGPLRVSSIYSLPIAYPAETRHFGDPGCTQQTRNQKSEIPIWDQNIIFQPVNAEKLMCSSYFGI